MYLNELASVHPARPPPANQWAGDAVKTVALCRPLYSSLLMKSVPQARLRLSDEIYVP